MIESAAAACLPIGQSPKPMANKQSVRGKQLHADHAFKRCGMMTSPCLPHRSSPCMQHTLQSWHDSHQRNLLPTGVCSVYDCMHMAQAFAKRHVHQSASRQSQRACVHAAGDLIANSSCNLHAQMHISNAAARPSADMRLCLQGHKNASGSAVTQESALVHISIMQS